MTDEPFDGSDMVGELLGEGQHLAYQTGHTLAQRVVKPLEVISCAHYFADGPMLRRGNHPFVHDILVGVTCGVLTIGHRNLGPEALGTPTTAVPHVKGNDLAAPGIQRDLDPRLIGLLLHKAAHVIRFHLQASHHDLAVAGDGLDVEMIR